MQHIVIIGAGVVGASIAFQLRGRARVTVIDASHAASGASGASFGWINASFFASPDHFMLRHAAIAAHRALDAQLGGTGVQWSGALCWEQGGAALQTQAEVLTELGYPVDVINRAEFIQLEPNVASPPDAALRLAAEGAVDAAILTNRLLQAAADHGVQTWFGCPAKGFSEKHGKITGVITPFGTIGCDQVILAAGTATQGLLGTLGIALPMLTRPGIVLHSRPTTQIITHILVTPDGEVRQDRAGRIIAPTAVSHQSDANDSLTKLPGDAAAAAIDRLRALLPFADLTVERVLVADRPVPQDGLPAIGAIGPDGLYVAVMHSGVTLAPLIGNLVAGEVLHGDMAQLLAPFRPTRFASV